jgi:hypothetical protein
MSENRKCQVELLDFLRRRYLNKVKAIRDRVSQRLGAEVPVNVAVADVKDGPRQRADQRLRTAKAKKGKRYRLGHRSVPASVW